MSDLLSGLNEAQRLAAETTEGPVMVMAGAGSGKTRVLTYRIAHLINDLGVMPYNILAVTFTNKAANEMKERISKLVDADIKKMWVATFHSICCRILRKDISRLNGYKTSFTILDEDDSVKEIKEAIKEMGLSTDEYKPKNVKCDISAFKNDMISSFDDNKIEEIYFAYERRLKDQNLLDFDDLILKTIELFEAFPDVLNKYQDTFSYLMIDEFQDTNTYQYKLVKLLGQKTRNIFIVGDQDQSIYSFRGARIENINKFQRDFVDTKVIMLEQNYRSTQNILDIANRVIGNNSNRFKKNLFTDSKDGIKPIFNKLNNAYSEACYVSDEIKRLMAMGYSYKDFAIIYRSNYISRNFEDVLLRQGIPYTIYGGLSFFSRKEVKDILAYIRLIIDFDDSFSFKRIVNEPKRKIGPALIKKLEDCAFENKCSLFKAIDLIERGGQGYNSLLDFKFTIIELEEYLSQEEHKMNEIVDFIINRTGYKAMLKAEGDEGEERLKNVEELTSVLIETDEMYEGTRKEKLMQMLQEIALRTDADTKREGDDVVKLMTYHQAKGLEYKVVFLVAFEEGVFPSSMASFSERDIEEERRICYVGITRARERLYITCVSERMIFGRTNAMYESRFLKEIDKKALEDKTVIQRKVFTDTNTKKPFVPGKVSSVVETKRTNTTDIAIGDKVNHKAFGDGTVVAVNGDVITVAFGEAFGVKKLLANHPSIRRL